jgi:cobalt-zinc-cadmium efflux system outer membrane protein
MARNIKIPYCLWLLIIILWPLVLYAEGASKVSSLNTNNLKGSILTVTEQQAIAIFYQRNLDLIAAQFNIDTAEAQEIIAAAMPNPVFTFSISELNPAIFKNQNKDTPLPAISPQIQLLIETAGKRRLRIESSELATEAVAFDLKDTTRVLTNAVRKSFYSLLLTQKYLEVANDNNQRYQEILKVNAIRLKVGDISEIDYTRIEVESLKAQSDQDQAITSLTQARANLLLLLAWPENSVEIQAVEDWPEAKAVIAEAKQDKLLNKALTQRPDLQAARIRIDQAGKMLTLAKRIKIPDVTVGAFYARDPGNFFGDTGGISFSVPLPLFYQQKGEISQARISLDSAQLAVTQAEQKVKSELMKALASWKSADAIAKRFEQSVVERIAALRDAQEYAYEKGAVGLLDLLDAERNYKAMMLDYYTALSNRSNAWADLIMAYGEEVKI